MCHICGHEEIVPSKCPAPECGNPAIRFSGLGTEKVEDVLRKLFLTPGLHGWTAIP